MSKRRRFTADFKAAWRWKRCGVTRRCERLRRGTRCIRTRFALNLFRLCLDIKTGFSHKNPSAQASQRGGRAGSPNEGGLPPSEGATKNLYP